MRHGSVGGQGFSAAQNVQHPLCGYHCDSSGASSAVKGPWGNVCVHLAWRLIQTLPGLLVEVPTAPPASIPACFRWIIYVFLSTIAALGHTIPLLHRPYRQYVKSVVKSPQLHLGAWHSWLVGSACPAIVLIILHEFMLSLQCLFPDGGFVWLDVRSTLENDEVGKVKGSVNVPFVNIKRVYNPETQQKDVKKEPNPDFIKMVRERPLPMRRPVCSGGAGVAYSPSHLYASRLRGMSTPAAMLLVCSASRAAHGCVHACVCRWRSASPTRPPSC